MTGKRIGSYFLVFFCFIAVVNAVMVSLAIRTYSGVVTPHPYEKGLAYNRVVEAAKAQEKLAWKSDISYTNGQLHFDLYDKNNQRLIPQKAIASITRPTQQGMDFELELKGAQTPVSFPAKGLWDVRVEVVHHHQRYQESRRIVIQ